MAEADGHLDDSEICDNWEDIVDNGELDRQLEGIKIKTINDCEDDGMKSKKLAKSFDYSNVRILQENGTRTMYVPSEPTVKILRRPGKNTESAEETEDKAQSRQTTKTLQQREAEYAEARKRIMGCGDNADDNVAVSTIVNKKKSFKVENKKTASYSVEVVRDPLGPNGTTGFSNR